MRPRPARLRRLGRGRADARRPRRQRCTSTRCAPADGSSTRGLIGAVGLRALRRRRDPAAREHDGRPGRGSTRPDDGDRGQPRADLPRLRRRRRGDRCRRRHRAVLPLASAITPDGTEHRIWAVTDATSLAAVAADLRPATCADRRRPPPLRDLPRDAAAAREAEAAPDRGTAAWPCWWTRRATGRRCTRSTACCPRWRCPTRSPARWPGPR